MPYRLSEWRDRIQKAKGEYWAAREACDRLKAQVTADANTVHRSLSEHLRQADLNLEGTYIIRVFAVFDAALGLLFRTSRFEYLRISCPWSAQAS